MPLTLSITPETQTIVQNTNPGTGLVRVMFTAERSDHVAITAGTWTSSNACVGVSSSPTDAGTAYAICGPTCNGATSTLTATVAGASGTATVQCDVGSFGGLQ